MGSPAAIPAAVFRASFGRVRGRCREIAQELLGVPVGYPFDHAIFKPPRNQTPTAWHQDGAYSHDPIPLRSIHFWIPLQAATESNGCMWFIPGSNRGEVLPHRLVTATARRGFCISVPMVGFVAGCIRGLWQPGFPALWASLASVADGRSREAVADSFRPASCPPRYPQIAGTCPDPDAAPRQRSFSTDRHCGIIKSKTYGHLGLGCPNRVLFAPFWLPFRQGPELPPRHLFRTGVGWRAPKRGEPDCNVRDGDL
jgi:hypothetical protein